MREDGASIANSKVTKVSVFWNVILSRRSFLPVPVSCFMGRNERDESSSLDLLPKVSCHTIGFMSYGGF